MEGHPEHGQPKDRPAIPPAPSADPPQAERSGVLGGDADALIRMDGNARFGHGESDEIGVELGGQGHDLFNPIRHG